MTVLAGGTVATFAATGVIAVPLSFPLLAVALGLFAIGYTRLARDVPHAAMFAALLTHGLGRTVGAAAAFVAVLSYNCVLTPQARSTPTLAHLGPVWAQHTPAWATTPVAATARTDLADAQSALATLHRQLRRVEPA
jgi:hypothetical protein